jgi:uncharacterized integral membrane protein
MIRKILAAIVLVPLAIIIVGLAVANREVVSVSFDPFNSVNPAFAIKAPLFILVLLLVIVGVVIGGIAAWLRQGKWRRTARGLDGELRATRSELEALRAEMASRDGGRATSSLALRPPAA